MRRELELESVDVVTGCDIKVARAQIKDERENQLVYIWELVIVNAQGQVIATACTPPVRQDEAICEPVQPGQESAQKN